MSALRGMRGMRLWLLLALLISFSGVLPAFAAGNDNNVEWFGTGHLPGALICSDTNFPYRNPLNPPANQATTIRARSYQSDLTGLTLWWTTNPAATTQGQWTSAAFSWQSNWFNCGGIAGNNMDIWAVNVPAQGQQVWYKLAYHDGTTTAWRRDAGEGMTGMHSSDGGWTTASTSLTYAPATTVYVDDDYTSSSSGGHTWGYDAFNTIQGGVNAVATGGTVEVAPGSYVEIVDITRRMTVEGPNTGLAGYNPLRGPEAIVYPPVSNLDVNTGLPSFIVSASDVTIDGMMLDGDNPSLGGGLAYDGADINQSYGIYNSTGNEQRITLTNLVVRNMAHYGIDMWSSTTSLGNVISNNLVEHMPINETAPTYYFGIGIAVIYNYYGQVVDNVVNGARVGVQTNTYWLPGAPSSISRNALIDVKRGIYHNVHFQTASPFTLDANVIVGTTSTITTEGIYLSSFAGTTTVTVTNSDIRDTRWAITGWNLTTSALPVVRGGALENNEIGVVLTNYDRTYAAGGASDMLVENVAITSTATGMGLFVEDYPGQTGVLTMTARGITVQDGATGAQVLNEHARLNLLESTLTGQSTGVAISGTAMLHRNTLALNQVGVLLEGGTLLQALENVIADSAVMGIRLSAGSVGPIVNNAITPQGMGIDNATGTLVNAEFNWWGTDDAAAVDALVSDDVDFSPFLSGGTDTAPATAGFQGSRDALTATSASPQLGGETHIQEAVGEVTSGGLVSVAAGAYVETVEITKPLTLEGPNAGLAGYDEARGAEAVVYPPANDVENAVSLIVSASDVTIDGMMLDGDNPNLSGGLAYDGADINQAYGIYNGYGNEQRITLTNLVIRNMAHFGIDMWADAPSTGNVISNNLVEHLPINRTTPNFYFGVAIATLNNYYADITDNVLDGVRVGVQTNNYWQAGVPTTISGNTINNVRRGIYHNLHYQNASPFTLDSNVITGTALLTNTDGVYLSSLQSSTMVTVTNTDVSNTRGAIVGWNLPTTALPVVRGGTLTNNQYGVVLSNFDRSFGAGGASDLLVEDIAVGGSGVGLFVEDYPGQPAQLSMTASAITATGGLSGALVLNEHAALTLSDSDLSGSSGAALDVQGGTAVIQRSTLDDSGLGILAAPGSVVTATNNSIAGNGTGFRNEASRTQFAECNWWGAASGPDAAGNLDGAGDTLIGAVDFSPWASSRSFSCTPSIGVGMTLAFTVQPSDVVLGTVIAPAIQVSVLDAQGNLALGYSGPITLSIASGPNGAALGGTLVVQAVNGVATFSNIAPDTIGSYTLSATGSELTSATSEEFDVLPLTLTLTPASVTLEPLGSAMLTVTLGSAPMTDTVVTLSFGGSGVSFPTSVTVPAGQTSAAFSIAGTTLTASGTLTATLPAVLGGASDSSTITTRALSPTITALDPSSVVVGSASISLTVTGSELWGGTVLWGGTPLSTTFVNSSTLIAHVDAALLAQVGTFDISVELDGGATSNTLPFTVTALGLTLTPASVTLEPLGSAMLTVTLPSALISDTVVTLTFGGSGVSFPASVTVPSGQTSATFSITGTTLTASGTLTATLPAALGGASDSSTIATRAQQPEIIALSPTHVVVGSASISLTVTGSELLGGTIYWRDMPLPTTAVDDGTLIAHVDAALLLQTGTYPITVRFPGGVRSNVLLFSVTNIGLTLTPETVALNLGESATLTATISAQQPVDTVVTISTSGISVTAPAMVTIPAGQTSVSFNVTAAVAGSTTTVTATLPWDLGGVSDRTTVTVERRAGVFLPLIFRQ